MTSEDAFLLAIREAPLDDTPRLIYADWLDEQGRPGGAARAEFIRVQCQMARLPREDPRWAELTRREAALLEENGADWQPFPECWQADRVKGPIQGWRRPEGLSFHDLLELLEEEGPFWSFQRGFPQLFVHHSTLADMAPVLPALGPAGLVHCCAGPAKQLDFPPQLFDFLADSSWQGRVAGLTCYSGGLPLSTPNVVLVPSLLRLRRVMTFSYLGTDRLSQLVQQPALPALRHLDLTDNSLGTDGVRLLATASWLAQLEGLVLDQNSFGLPAMRDLLRGPVRRLATLSLEECLLYPDEIAALGEVGNLTGLRTLCLCGNLHLSDRGAEVLAGSPLLGRLTWLDLERTYLGDAGARHLAASPRAGSLRFLLLSGNQVGDPGAIALAESPHLRQLEFLDLRGNFVCTTTGKLALREAFGERVVWSYPDSGPANP
jgi:uncharacterized protein (TIGR02996 family)